MTATLAPPVAPAPPDSRQRWMRMAPVIVAALLGVAYVIVSPATQDLAAHLFRAQLFREQGFGLWDNNWYGGHHIVGYSVLFPAVSAWLSPQLTAAIAATGTAAVFEPLARRHFGERAWLGALLFGAATAIDLYSGRLALAFGALPALGAVAALDAERPLPAAGLGALSALCSPVAALFAALVACGYGFGALISPRPGQRVLSAVAVAAATLAPVGALAVAFPEGGTEPFALLTLVPVLVVAAVVLITIPRSAAALRTGVAVYAAACVVVYLVPSSIGSNIARLGTLLAAPLAALLWWQRRRLLLAIAIVPLLYIGWQAPVSDVALLAGDPSTQAGFYGPLLRFLHRQTALHGPFRVEIPLTRSHWEAYRVARYFPIARGWERQLDRRDNAIFYQRRLTAAGYEDWLARNAVRFVATPDVALDYSARAEMALIARGLPYLRLAMRSAHWRVYAVADPTPLAGGVARATALGTDSVSLQARSAGQTVVRVRWTPYWALAQGAGCVAPAGDYTRVTLRHGGSVRLVIRFALGRIGARSPRCT